MTPELRQAISELAITAAASIDVWTRPAVLLLALLVVGLIALVARLYGVDEVSRLMSVSLTEDAVRDRTKTVTRRLGWLFLKPGDRLTLCRKVMGRKPGEPLVRIVEVEVLHVNREPLRWVTDDDVVAEGFPDLTPGQFIEMFCKHIGATRDTEVTRIEWRYL